MKLRRIGVGAFAFAMFAAVGFFPAAAAGGSAAKTICVGLIVDSRAIGGSVSDGCATVKPGSTGIDVLEALGHSVTFRHDGLLCTIDGLPKAGCSAVDDSHYWAYYHRAPDGTTWSYSDEGAGTYQPVNRSTDGWVYDDGSSLKPDNIPAAKICAALVKPTATPTPTRSVPPRPTSATMATPPAADSQTKSAPTGAGHRSRSPSATPSAATSTPSSSQMPHASATPSAASTNHGNATGAIITAAVIAVIAVITSVTVRRRGR